jgi:hypothetical protein
LVRAMVMFCRELRGHGSGSSLMSCGDGFGRFVAGVVCSQLIPVIYLVFICSLV